MNEKGPKGRLINKFRIFGFMTILLVAGQHLMIDKKDIRKFENQARATAFKLAEEDFAMKQGTTLNKLRQQIANKCYQGLKKTETKTKSASRSGIFSAARARGIRLRGCSRLAVIGPQDAAKWLADANTTIRNHFIQMYAKILLIAVLISALTVYALVPCYRAVLEFFAPSKQ